VIDATITEERRTFVPERSAIQHFYGLKAVIIAAGTAKSGLFTHPTAAELTIKR
jgi:hypothetical protein